MIDVKDYHLIYFCKKTKKQVNAKTVGVSQIAVLDNGISTTYTIAAARKLYKGSRENRKAKNKLPHTRLTISRKGISPKKFNEYLNEGEDKLVSNF